MRIDVPSSRAVALPHWSALWIGNIADGGSSAYRAVMRLVVARHRCATFRCTPVNF